MSNTMRKPINEETINKKKSVEALCVKSWCNIELLWKQAVHHLVHFLVILLQKVSLY
jgi:hypothetical protein